MAPTIQPESQHGHAPGHTNPMAQQAIIMLSVLALCLLMVSAVMTGDLALRKANILPLSPPSRSPSRRPSSCLSRRLSATTTQHAAAARNNVTERTPLLWLPGFMRRDSGYCVIIPEPELGALQLGLGEDATPVRSVSSASSESSESLTGSSAGGSSVTLQGDAVEGMRREGV